MPALRNLNIVRKKEATSLVHSSPYPFPNLLLSQDSEDASYQVGRGMKKGGGWVSKKAPSLYVVMSWRHFKV